MQLDIEDSAALRDYLTVRGCAKPGETVLFKNLQGGVSNRTVKVAWADGRSWVLKQALPKLRVSVDWFSSPERIGVEAKALRCLNQLAPPGTTPAFVFEDMPNYLMGMEAVPDEPENWKSVLLSGRIISDHFEQFGLLLGAIHRRSSESGPEIRSAFADTTYFENLRLEPYYLYAAQNIAEANVFLTALACETLHHKDSLVHGDFSPKNVLVHNKKLILLDHEVLHFGDPAFDVGFSLTHFLSKALHLPRQRDALVQAAQLYWGLYLDEVRGMPWVVHLDLRAAQHTLASLLARVCGRSPLEYLSREERLFQRQMVIEMIEENASTVERVIAGFSEKIRHASQRGVA